MVNDKDELQALQRIATAMERIANVFEANNNTQLQGLNVAPYSPNIQSNSDVTCLEQKFFEIITNIYAEEEKIKIERNLKRKGSRRVASELVNQISSFFNKNLDDIYAQPIEHGYIVLKKEQTPIALFRFQTDLGFTRGEKWKDSIDRGLKTADDLGIEKNHVYFMVGAIKNSLDNSHIQKLLGTNDVPDNSILLTNSYRPLLEKYLDLYVQSMTSLPNPQEQIYFLVGAEHPNEIAWDAVTNNTPYPKNIAWLKPSISDLISAFKTL